MTVNNKEMVPFEHYTEEFRKIDPAEAAARCGVRFDNETKTFTVRLLRADYRVTWPDFSIASDTENAFALANLPAQMLIIRYLMEGKASAPSSNFVTYREMPWGEVYIKPFTGRCITRAAYAFGTRPAAFAKAAEKIGGFPIGKGDASAQLEVMPGYDVRLIVWEGDDEFPPNAQILFSDNFPNAFSAEDRTVVGDIVISELKRNMK